MLNRVSLMGRLTADPELRHTQTGTAVASFRIAVERDFKDKTTGERGADFFSVTAWSHTAEFVSRFFTKGRMAVVDGRLQTREWQNKDGEKRFATDIVADNVYFGDSKRDSAGDGDREPYPYQPQTGGESHDAFADITDSDDDTLPF